jgi:hypothetical protein
MSDVLSRPHIQDRCCCSAGRAHDTGLPVVLASVATLTLLTLRRTTAALLNIEILHLDLPKNRASLSIRGRASERKDKVAPFRGVASFGAPALVCGRRTGQTKSIPVAQSGGGVKGQKSERTAMTMIPLLIP